MRTGGICSYAPQKKSIRQDITTMPNYRFPINGIRHHDFKGRLDELYELAPGKRMSISVEHDNVGEKDAVIVYWGSKFVGYVRSGEDRERAVALIETSGRGSLLGRIVGVDRDNRWLWMEITTETEIAVTHEDKPNLLTNWTFDGETLPLDEEEHRLHTMLCNLEMTTEALEPWDDEMAEWLAYVEENLWRDISLETSEHVKQILGFLTVGSTTYPEYARAASRLQYSIDYMASPEVRRLQAQQIIDKAHTDAMTLLLLHYDDAAKEAILQLPKELVTLFLKDGEAFMGRLWYLHRPTKQIRALNTLLSMMVRLKDNSGEDASTSIPREWLLQWGANQQDKRKAEFVQEVLARYEMERTNPELAEKIEGMLDCCNAQHYAAIDRQTEALKEVARKPTSITANSLSISNPSLLKQDLNFNAPVDQVVAHADKIETSKEDK